MKWKRDHDAVYWFDMTIAQDKGTGILADDVQRHHIERLHASRLHDKNCQQDERDLVPWGKDWTANCSKGSTQAHFSKCDCSAQSSDTTALTTVNLVDRWQEQSSSIIKLEHRKTCSKRDPVDIPGRSSAWSRSQELDRQRCPAPSWVIGINKGCRKNCKTSAWKDTLPWVRMQKFLKINRATQKVLNYAMCLRKFSVDIACTVGLRDTYTANAAHYLFNLKKNRKPMNKWEISTRTGTSHGDSL